MELSKLNLHNVPTDFRLNLGMTGTVEITVSRRQVITYFFYSIAKSFKQRFREY